VLDGAEQKRADCVERPETQERAWEIFPELKSYPEEYHAENLNLTSFSSNRPGKMSSPSCILSFVGDSQWCWYQLMVDKK